MKCFPSIATPTLPSPLSPSCTFSCIQVIATIVTCNGRRHLHQGSGFNRYIRTMAAGVFRFLLCCDVIFLTTFSLVEILENGL